MVEQYWVSSEIINPIYGFLSTTYVLIDKIVFILGSAAEIDLNF